MRMVIIDMRIIIINMRMILTFAPQRERLWCGGGQRLGFAFLVATLLSAFTPFFLIFIFFRICISCRHFPPSFLDALVSVTHTFSTVSTISEA